MSRTTIDLDPAVVRELRERSHREGKPMGQVASELLARSLAGDMAAKVAPFEWISRELGRPVVNLEDKEALRAALESS